MTENILSERLKKEERFYREAGDAKGPHVHHSPDRCKQTADLLKEAREALGERLIQAASRGGKTMPEYSEDFFRNPYPSDPERDKLKADWVKHVRRSLETPDGKQFKTTSYGEYREFDTEEDMIAYLTGAHD